MILFYGYKNTTSDKNPQYFLINLQTEHVVRIMAEHNELGQLGELLAADYLRRKGYVIAHSNWRSGHKELDLIARLDDLVVFVEVKTRRDDVYGQPEDAVNRLKIRRIIDSADAYVRRFNIDGPIRFDIITVIKNSSEVRIEHIEDAFQATMF